MLATSYRVLPSNLILHSTCSAMLLKASEGHKGKVSTVHEVTRVGYQLIVKLFDFIITIEIRSDLVFEI